MRMKLGGDRNLLVQKGSQLEDNNGLWHALTSGFKLYPFSIYDTNIISSLEPEDRRMGFIGNILETLNRSIKLKGSSLQIFTGTPIETFRELVLKYKVKALYLTATMSLMQ